MTIYAKVILGFLVIVLAFISGWRVEYWHYSAEREDELTSALTTQNKNMNTLIDAHNKEVTRIDTINSQTAADQIHTQLLIQAQNDAIDQIQSKLQTLKVGSCTFNSNADSVLGGAYQAAFGAPATPASKKAKH